jgi:Protein of unknown function (DUF1071)
MTTTKSVFETLSQISIKEKIERKGNLDYLSWANAWSMLKTIYPDAQRKVYEHDATGFNYFTDGKSAWVKVGIIVNGIEHIDYLPIMDFRNNAVSVDKVTATDVNKAIQRSTAKAIAMHGLGLSLWTGEDVPEMVATAPVVVEKIQLKKDTEGWTKVTGYLDANKSMGVEKLMQQIEGKYIITPALKKELVTLINKK